MTRVVSAATLALAGLFTALLLQAQEKAAETGPAFQEMTEKQEKSIAKGIDWLLKTQNANGLWGCEKATSPSTAITGLAVLALLASGSTTSEGLYTDPINKAVDRLLAVQNKHGQITQFDSTGMGIFYDHSCAVLALSEAYGMRRETTEESKVLQEKIDLAIALIYNKQCADGGFNPQGATSGSDLGITANVWMALRSANNAGITVKNANVEKVQAFVKKCAERGGGFSQAPGQGGGKMFYPTSAGLRIMYGMGKNDLPEVVKGTELLLKKAGQNPVLGSDYGGQISEWDYCAAFYAVQALMLENGPAWKKWFPIIRDYLIKIQNADGSWTIQYCTSCRAYATALSLIVLQAPKRLLPLFQL